MDLAGSTGVVEGAVGGPMVGLPSGTVTFLFTDLEGSTRLWQEHPDAMPAGLARHDEILRDAMPSHAGQVVKMTGDGVHAVFGDKRDAIVAAVPGSSRWVGAVLVGIAYPR